ncbi:MAG: hypothetical protein IKC32_02970 [Clostridia bacterium]|nr:hypothetical protein [Clostridia bacterium]
MARHPIIDFLKGYEPSAEGKGKRFVSREISGNVGDAHPSRFSQRLKAIGGGIVDLLSYTTTRTYGLFFGSFGILTLLAHFALDYFSYTSVVDIGAMLFAAIVTVLSIPFLAVDKPIAIATQENRLTDALFFEFFCMQRMPKKSVAHTVHPIFGLLIGAALAALGTVLPVWAVIASIIVAYYVYLAAISPEFSFFFTILVMPYLPLLPNSDVILAGLVFMTLFSFIKKTSEGKRIYYFEKYDLMILIMLGFVFISGVVVGGFGSASASLIMLLLGFGGYALTGSLVVNRRMADGVIKAVILSSLPVSVVAIVQWSRAAIGGRLSAFGGSRGTFDSPDTLAAFLLVAALFMLYFALNRTKRSTKIVYGLYLVPTVLALAATLRPWLIGALLGGILATLAMKAGRLSKLLIGLIAFLPYTMLFMPSSWLNFLGEASAMRALGFDRYFLVWLGAREQFVDHIFVGVGTGDWTDAPDSANFLLQIGCEAGVFVLVMFLLIFIVRLDHRSVYAPYSRLSEVSSLVDFSNVTIIVLIVWGVFTSLWTSPVIYYLFWCVFGLGSAVLRISKREFDGRVSYFSDGSDIDSASIDISLKR